MTADEAGRYRVPGLTPGTYELAVTADGFAELSRKGVSLATGQDAILDLTLDSQNAAAQPSQQPDASMTGSQGINLSSGAVAGLVDDRQVRDLPLNGRSFSQLVALEPGVVVAYAGGNDVTCRTPKLSINGARPDAIQFLMDGTNIDNFIGKTPGSSSGLLLGVDGVFEFRVLANAYSADFGRVNGGAIQAVTRWGSNSLHGSAFEFLRNSKFDAKKLLRSTR